jgi:hypothetical protein
LRHRRNLEERPRFGNEPAARAAFAARAREAFAALAGVS